MPTVQEHAPGTPSWFDLMSPDLEGALAFYQALFGWDYHRNGPEMGHYTIALKGGRMAAGVSPSSPEAQMPSAWSTYFATADVDASVAAVLAHGGGVMMPPLTVSEQGRMAICTDPTGAVFGFWQPGTHRGAGVFAEHGAMAWSELHTRQGEIARDFYAAVLGLTHQPMPGMTYWTLHLGEGAVAGVWQAELPAGAPAHWVTYFAVADADAAVSTVQAHGGAVLSPAVDTPYGRMAVVADPYGAKLTVIQRQGA